MGRKSDSIILANIRGDDILFIERRHIIADGWRFDGKVAKFLAKHVRGRQFFRIIENGKQTHYHGWVELKGKTAEIVQWG